MYKRACALACAPAGALGQKMLCAPRGLLRCHWGRRAETATAMLQLLVAAG